MKKQTFKKNRQVILIITSIAFMLLPSALVGASSVVHSHEDILFIGTSETSVPEPSDEPGDGALYCKGPWGFSPPKDRMPFLSESQLLCHSPGHPFCYQSFSGLIDETTVLKVEKYPEGEVEITIYDYITEEEVFELDLGDIDAARFQAYKIDENHVQIQIAVRVQGTGPAYSWCMTETRYYIETIDLYRDPNTGEWYQG